MYPPILRAPVNCGLVREESPLAREADGRYAIDVDGFRSAIRERTRIFLLCNPHNPVGRVWERSDLARMAEICLERDLTIIADEIHCDLVYTGHQRADRLARPQVERRTITPMAPSKTQSAGLKSSIAIIPDARSGEVRGVSARPRQGGEHLRLRGDARRVPRRPAVARRPPAYLEANATSSPSTWRTTCPASCGQEALSWLDCRGAKLPKDDPFAFFLERAKVALNDGAAFGTPGRGFARLTSRVRARSSPRARADAAPLATGRAAVVWPGRAPVVPLSATRVR
jgi:cystathionine beta-lyase